MKLRYWVLLLVFLSSACSQKEDTQYDICVYGATSAGVMAAYSAKMKGKTVIIIEPGYHLGGLTSGGLGQTDIGNKYAITGLSRDFYQKIGNHYGRLEQWTFEPHVAKGIFQSYLDKAGIEVKFGHEIIKVQKSGKRITSIELNDTKAGSKFDLTAKVFIDCSYEGDLMAKAGVSYTIGRESNETYGENFNGVQLMDKHQFMDGIDPYNIKGDPKSGLLWGIASGKLAERGSGDNKLQAYNFRLCLTDSVENMLPITRPVGYDSTRFELLLRYIEKKQAKELNWAHMHIQPMPGRKTDINNSGPFSTDYIGANYKYPDATYAERKEIIKDHKLYTESLLYFLGNDPRVPEHLRKEMKSWGYPKDEFVDFGNFTPQLYVREARRMVSDYVMTEKHCVGEETAEDGIGLAAYTMDSHNCQRMVVDGMVKNEGDVQEGLGGLPPYPISYRSIIPKKAECDNLIVPVCLSASHIAFGSIRMEPVFMVLGQSAGVAASLAIENGGNVHEVTASQIQEDLKLDPTSDGRVGIITMDNDDEGIAMQGNWSRDTKYSGRYGKSIMRTKVANTSFTFISNSLQDSKYDAYIYFPSGVGLSEKVGVRIKTQGKEDYHQLYINNKDADWVFITQLEGEQEKDFSFSIENLENQKEFVVDAIILKPQENGH
ncbi:FAD dependent oxidoreductase [Spirosomataceae bacterium TFI 002]|nr:FAD dependent oxidoreductase [Spirosomataceae bacterium TFI 002]